MNKIKIECTQEQLDYIVNLFYVEAKIEDLKNIFGISPTICKSRGISVLEDLFERTEPKRWRAEKYQGYYFVRDCGAIALAEDLYEDKDNNRYRLGNYFKTEDEAIKYACKVYELFAERP